MRLNIVHLTHCPQQPKGKPTMIIAILLLCTVTALPIARCIARAFNV